jgi:peroxiredoxin
MEARKRFLALTGALLILPVAAALGWLLAPAEADLGAVTLPPDPLRPGAYAWNAGDAPDVTFETLDGGPVSLGAYRGKLVLLNFWATWCPPCLREIPELVRLHDDLTDRGVAIVGIAAQSGSAEKIRAFMDEHSMDYPVWTVDDASLDEFGVVGFPFSFLIDRDGRIRMRYVGPQSYERLLADIVALLEEEGTGASS